MLRWNCLCPSFLCLIVFDYLSYLKKCHMRSCGQPWPDSCLDVIETCLFVLWRHLEYYLLHCIPTDPKDSLLPGSTLYRSRLADGRGTCYRDNRFIALFGYWEQMWHKHCMIPDGVNMNISVCSNSLDSFSGLQASGGRGLSLSRVSQQDLDLVRNSCKLVWVSCTQLYILGQLTSHALSLGLNHKPFLNGDFHQVFPLAWN